MLASPARARLRRAEAKKKTPLGRAERGEAASPLGNNIIKHNNRHANKDQNDDVKFNLHINPLEKWGEAEAPPVKIRKLASPTGKDLSHRAIRAACH